VQVTGNGYNGPGTFIVRTTADDTISSLTIRA
jgi:hypothetical protein